MENFDDIKVGDEVAILGQWLTVIKKVTKVTPKRFFIGCTSYNKSDGKEIGTVWLKDRCVHPTDEIRKEIARQQKFGMMKSKLRDFTVNSLDYEKTEKLYNFMLENDLIK